MNSPDNPPPMVPCEFALAEPTGACWKNEIVHFDIEGTPGLQSPGPWALEDQQGRQYPAQVETTGPGRAVLHACVDLQPGETLKLRSTQTGVEASPFRIEDQGRTWLAGNGVIDVRIPSSRSFQAGESPAPVISGRADGGEWLGEGRVTGLKWVGEIDSEVLATGPVFARWKVRYTVGGKTAATFVCTLYRGADFVWLEEESSTDFDLRVEYCLDGTQAPDALLSHGQGEHPQRIADIRYTTHGKIFHIDFNSGWHQMSNSWCGLFRRDRPELLGVLEMRGGTWTKVGRNRIEIHESPDRSVRVLSPLRGGAKQWALMFSSVEKNLAPDLPYGSPACSHLGETHQKWSELPLSKVRNWHLDWVPSHPEGGLRLFGEDRLPAIRSFWESRAEIAEVFGRHARGYLEADEGSLRSDAANALAAEYLLSNSPESARRAKLGLLPDLRVAFEDARDHGYHTLIIFHGRRLKLDLQAFDILDALGHITDEERKEVARMVAFLAHCFRDRDFFPFELNMLEREDEQSWAPEFWDEIGDTLCPPNFMTEYITSFGMAGCMFPDHPDAAEWRDDAVRLYERQLERHYYDGGVYCESLNYHHHNMVMTTQLALALRENGHFDFFEHPRFRDQYGVWVDLVTPPIVRNEAGMGLHSPQNSADSGAERLRMIPSNGNTGRDCSDYAVPAELALAAAVYGDSDPDYAGRLMQAWREGGRVCLNHYNMSSFLLVADPSLPEADSLSLGSKLLHGLGATFRGGDGGEDEVYALVKCGWGTHHNDMDEGGFCIWAYGAPLSSDQGYHYQELDGNTYGGCMTKLHNCITFGHMSPSYAGQESAFPPESFVSTDRADLLVAYLPIDYLMELPERSYLELVPCSRIEHRRYFLFVKPHYFLVYDHLPVNEYSTQWYLHCQSNSVELSGSRIRFEGKWGVDLEAQLLLPSEPQIKEGQFGVQKHVVAQQAGPRDYFAWIAPVKAGTEFDVRQGPRPDMVSVTGPGYEDTVFMSPTPFSFEDRELSFKGRVGVARRADGRLTTELLDGEALEART